MSVWNDEFNRLCKAGAVSGPVSDLAIGQAENELGVQFPSEYHEFLRKYGAVFTRGVEVYGLIQVEEDGNPPLWQDVVTVTKQLRAMGQAGTDKNSFIPICDDGMGCYFYLDTSATHETKILPVGPGIERTYDANLFKFLVDLSNLRPT